MIKIENILTVRKYRNQLTFRLIYEWEDIISKSLNIPLKSSSLFWDKVQFRFNKNPFLTYMYKKIYALFHRGYSLYFVMRAETYPMCQINKRIIPVIIDFWLKEEQFNAFYNAYKDCKLILITSAEVYSKLKQLNCPLNIYHWPLSFPDNYYNPQIVYNKEYDLAFIGRKDKYFENYLQTYCKKYPDFKYITNSDDMENRSYYLNDGTIICDGRNKDDYFNIIRKSKITFYSTPGIDQSKIGANGYNQVTPRFFEMLSGGCYILGHYPNNEDTKYYQISDICPNITNYEEFEHYMNTYRKTEVSPNQRNFIFLKNHLTTKRAELLQKILDLNKR